MTSTSGLGTAPTRGEARRVPTTPWCTLAASGSRTLYARGPACRRWCVLSCQRPCPAWLILRWTSITPSGSRPWGCVRTSIPPKDACTRSLWYVPLAHLASQSGVPFLSVCAFCCVTRHRSLTLAISLFPQFLTFCFFLWRVRLFSKPSRSWTVAALLMVRTIVRVEAILFLSLQVGTGGRSLAVVVGDRGTLRSGTAVICPLPYRMGWTATS